MKHKHKWQYAGETGMSHNSKTGWHDSQLKFVCVCGTIKIVDKKIYIRKKKK